MFYSTKKKCVNEKLIGYVLAIPAMPQEFKYLRLGAVYWVAIEQHQHAVKLAGETLASISAIGKAILLTHTYNEIDEVLAYLSKPNQGPSDLHSYKLKVASLQVLQQLPKQIDRVLKPMKRLIVLLLPINEMDLWQDNASSLLREWRNWAESRACTLLIISYGINAKVLAHDLYAENNSLSGLAMMYASQSAPDSELVYEIQHWRSGLGVKGKKDFKLRVTDTFFDLVLDPKSQGQPVTRTAVKKKNELIFERSVLEGAPNIMTDNWQVVDSWAELIEKGLRIVSPILVFALNTNEEVEDLARILYRLRQQRSDAIKIIVREMHQSLRKQEVELLIKCGASLVVLVETKLARFFSLLERIKEQPSVYYQLTDNLERAIAAVKPQPVRGVLASLPFCDYVEGLANEIPLTDSVGVLIALRPVPMLSAEMVLSQIKLTRMGDVACASNGVVYLFLFGCKPDFAMFTLQRVFKLPFRELVIENLVYSEQASIEEQIFCIRNYHTPKDQTATINSAEISEDKTEKKLLFQPIIKSLNS